MPNKYSTEGIPMGIDTEAKVIAEQITGQREAVFHFKNGEYLSISGGEQIHPVVIYPGYLKVNQFLIKAVEIVYIDLT